MKKLILLALTAVIMAGCYEAKAYRDKQIDLVSDYRPVTIEYQGCEYVVMQSYRKRHGTMVHKGNCCFCKERREKEIKELLKQLNK